jgi:phosphoglycolate phosphatase
MKYQGIIFDKDGTLLDFNKTWLPIYRFAAEQFSNGDPLLADELLHRHGFDHSSGRFIGGSLLAAGNNNEIAAAWASQLNQHSMTDDFSQRLNHIFSSEGSKQATAVVDLAATLTRLKNAGVKLGVATADSYQGIINTLESFNVLDSFDFLAGYDSGYGVKPGGGMVTAFCQQLGLSADKVVVVGDNRHDIEMGRNANAGLCVGVLTGTSTRADLESIADIVLPDISHLPELLSLHHR